MRLTRSLPLSMSSSLPAPKEPDWNKYAFSEGFPGMPSPNLSRLMLTALLSDRILNNQIVARKGVIVPLTAPHGPYTLP